MQRAVDEAGDDGPALQVDDLRVRAARLPGLVVRPDGDDHSVAIGERLDHGVLGVEDGDLPVHEHRGARGRADTAGLAGRLARRRSGRRAAGGDEERADAADERSGDGRTFGSSPHGCPPSPRAGSGDEYWRGKSISQSDRALWRTLADIP